MTRFSIERACAWSGLLGIVLFFAGFVLCRFIPPLSPVMTAAQVAAHYQAHANGIRGGMVITLISGMFVAPMVGLIATYMARVPGLTPAVAAAQICAGTLNIVFFMVPAVLFVATAYRPDRPVEITFLMNDLSWIAAVLPWPPAFMQSMTIVVAAFCDRGARPVFPRWLGYLNIWVATGYLPGGLLPFFTSGPLAWSGLLVFWLAGTMFSVWFVATSVALLQMINRAERDAAGS